MSNNTSSGSMGILSWLQVIFIVLKVLDLIDWPWRKVFMPTWIYIGILLVLATLLAINEMIH